MTPINRRLQRLSSASVHSQGKSRPVVVELCPDGVGKPGAGFVGFRLAGTRTTYYLPIDHCYREAIRNELARKRAERKRVSEAKRKEGAK